MPQTAMTVPSLLADHFRGPFEVHVTVSADSAELATLAAWAGARGIKFTHIVLARGMVSSQPMLTARASGTLGSVCQVADELVGNVTEAGFAVVRAKIEAAPDAAGVPTTAADAAALPDDMYFEHHVKVLLDAGFDEADLTSSVIPHGAHLSRNARRVRDDGQTERFVTQRCRHVGLAAAGKRLDRLVGSLISAQLHVQSIEREFVVFDSAPAVDAGWIMSDASAT